MVCPSRCTVLLQSWLYEYFTSRDVTMNEVLIIKQGPGHAMFYYTRDALRDVQLQMVSYDMCRACAFSSKEKQSCQAKGSVSALFPCLQLHAWQT
jgi:hypothetical protein